MKIRKEFVNTNTFILTNPVAVREKLSEKIRKCRLMNRWSQRELCKRAGVNLGTYRVFEQTGHISLDRFCQVAVALGRAEELGKLFEPPPVTSLENLPDTEPKIPQRGRTL